MSDSCRRNMYILTNKVYNSFPLRNVLSRELYSIARFASFSHMCYGRFLYKVKQGFREERATASIYSFKK